ncbi:Suppressor of cytokine signaling 2 [Armadillidium nasatum]|uniref:Suppressor of cytokine signaling 2 n=1 Tax=Armadillidium nasatum TaxID=96803 RepID=A0A5N5SRL6_9CRUS|nr:Suppressor of cytokine signaling 2 [Armadillidium nasatum]
METLSPHIQKPFPWRSNSESLGVEMSSVLVCPNCRSTLAPCVSVTCPLAATPTSVQCQACASASACLARGIVPHFPLPYVCRHWLQVSPSTCSHGHTCSDSTKFFSPQESSYGHHQAVRCHSFHGDSPKTRTLSTLSHGISKNHQNRFSVISRGESPHNGVMPNFSFQFSENTFDLPKKAWTSEDDERVFRATKEELEECGWYYGSLSWQEAASLLANTSEGTFLVRDSSSSHCPYALSVQTPQGPTSIRIEYEKGKFWLACEKKGTTPQLGGVIELIEFYKALAISNDPSRNPGGNQFQPLSHSGKHVWVDHRGKVFSPIKVIKPLRKDPPSLQHLCRLAIRQLPASQVAVLPPPITAYLKQYQHDL